jgi:cytochrome bd ubiquinol oxidase subunit I
MDPIFLSRIQFAANISFHILFPTITIALAWVLLYFKLRFNRSGEAHWMRRTASGSRSSRCPSRLAS